MNWLKRAYHRLGQAYISTQNKKEYLNQAWKTANERPVEYRFVFDQLVKLAPQSVLDVGTGATALPALISACGIQVTAIDNIQDYWPAGVFNKYYYVLNDDIRHPLLNQCFDFITCVSVLEHIPEHEKAICSMATLLHPGGHLILTFPYHQERYFENVYKLPGASYGMDAPYICQVFSGSEVTRWRIQSQLQVVDQEYWQIFTGDLWAFGKRLSIPRQVTLQQPHQLSCLVFKKGEMSQDNLSSELNHEN